MSVARLIQFLYISNSLIYVCDNGNKMIINVTFGADLDLGAVLASYVLCKYLYAKSMLLVENYKDGFCNMIVKV